MDRETSLHTREGQQHLNGSTFPGKSFPQQERTILDLNLYMQMDTSRPIYNCNGENFMRVLLPCHPLMQNILAPYSLPLVHIDEMQPSWVIDSRRKRRNP